MKDVLSNNRKENQKTIKLTLSTNLRIANSKENTNSIFNTSNTYLEESVYNSKPIITEVKKEKKENFFKAVELLNLIKNSKNSNTSKHNTSTARDSHSHHLGSLSHSNFNFLADKIPINNSTTLLNIHAKKQSHHINPFRSNLTDVIYEKKEETNNTKYEISNFKLLENNFNLIKEEQMLDQAIPNKRNKKNQTYFFNNDEINCFKSQVINQSVKITYENQIFKTYENKENVNDINKRSTTSMSNNKRGIILSNHKKKISFCALQNSSNKKSVTGSVGASTYEFSKESVEQTKRLRLGENNEKATEIFNQEKLNKVKNSNNFSISYLKQNNNASTDVNVLNFLNNNKDVEVKVDKTKKKNYSSIPIISKNNTNIEFSNINNNGLSSKGKYTNTKSTDRDTKESRIDKDSPFQSHNMNSLKDLDEEKEIIQTKVTGKKKNNKVSESTYNSNISNNNNENINSKKVVRNLYSVHYTKPCGLPGDSDSAIFVENEFNQFENQLNKFYTKNNEDDEIKDYLDNSLNRSKITNTSIIKSRVESLNSHKTFKSKFKNVASKKIREEYKESRKNSYNKSSNMNNCNNTSPKEQQSKSLNFSEINTIEKKFKHKREFSNFSINSNNFERSIEMIKLTADKSEIKSLNMNENIKIESPKVKKKKDKLSLHLSFNSLHSAENNDTANNEVNANLISEANEILEVKEGNDANNSFKLFDKENTENRYFKDDTFADIITNEIDKKSNNNKKENILNESQFIPTPIFDVEFVKNIIDSDNKNKKIPILEILDQLDDNNYHKFIHTRASTIFWMSEISEDFGFKRDTFYLAIDYLDKYTYIKAMKTKFYSNWVNLFLNCNNMKRLASGCLLISSKIEEIQIPRAIEYISVNNDETFTVESLMEIEKDVLKVRINLI